ncbi:hypothetical protein GGR50DRAFT_672717 [Xylaria sp. CBS 124048]|nr:hypothetical protein GGR50DRAFT_672717 [Xylaria sp. CBS 124048]
MSINKGQPRQLLQASPSPQDAPKDHFVVSGPPALDLSNTQPTRNTSSGIRKQRRSLYSGTRNTPPPSKNILRVNCSQQYQAYRYGTQANLTLAPNDGPRPSLLPGPVIDCLLDNLSEYIKSSLASAQVLLGLLPTMLALLGTSSRDLGFLAVIARRPVLAALLALASPSICMGRAFQLEQGEPVGMLKHSEGSLKPWSPQGWRRWFFLVVVQYIFVLAALASVAGKSLT